tara:strand:- start:1465 stop:1995 length:531 start_codon:yes stop_codon:yes gene_type:complete
VPNHISAEDALNELEVIITSALANATAKTILDLEQTILTLRASGATDDAIRQILLNDLSEGGIIFGPYRNAIKNTTGNAVQLMSEVAIRGKYGDANIQEFKWVTAGVNVCVDCKPRHGKISTWPEWSAIGLPRSGFSVCKGNCQCQLVPASYTDEEIFLVNRRKQRKKELKEKFGA